MILNTKNFAAATVLICALGGSGYAQAGAPSASGPMPLGAAAPPPQAYMDFCSRQPRDCQVSREAVLSQIGTLGVEGRGVQAATATIRRPAGLTVEVAPAILRSTARASFSFAVEATDKVNWRDLINDAAAADGAATSVGEARISLSSFRFEASGAEPAPAPAAPIASDAEPGATLIMDAQTWATVNRVNARVNRDIIRKTDIANFGVGERWSTPLEDGTKFGDCEDYVLEKRRALIAEGFPPSTLSIAVVTTSWDTTHAVLLVAGDKGEYVLDNLSPWVVPWNEAPYTFRKRQVGGDAFHWVTVTPSASSLKYAGLNLIAL